MAQVTIYSSDYCPFCHRAKQLLSQKGILYTEIKVDGNPSARQEMIAKANRTSVPQIWINELHVGGCDDLYALEHAGKLDTLLQG
ncbi:glutaredoxin 3 [Pseudomonas sp. F1_0610]|uniref:glutaredoxin 3 n=1 Tax=Pseudomonas sp. F1_0610 TaxID=3114284 RepID=UPI0039C47654